MLSLQGNPIADILCYTDKIFKLLPNISVLDGYDRDGNDIESEDEGAKDDHDDD